jgi:hypothetical protein
LPPQRRLDRERAAADLSGTPGREVVERLLSGLEVRDEDRRGK